MTIVLCIAGYLLMALIALFIFAYVDRTRELSEQGGDDSTSVILALIWPVILLILLAWAVVDVPLWLADRYARKHNLKKKEAQS